MCSSVIIFETSDRVSLTDLAVDAPPARDALLVTSLVTPVVSELVVSRATELGASGVEVMQVTLHTHSVGDARRVPVIVQRVPVRTGQDNPRVRSLVDEAVRGYGTQTQ
jgi:hypothetical protein